MNVVIPNFYNVNMLVVGDIILDKYWYGSINKISSEFLSPVFKINEVQERLGGAANVAANAIELGCNVKLIGITGTDESAKSIINLLNLMNVKYDLISFSKYPTVTKLRIILHDRKFIRFDFENKFSDIDAFNVIEKVKSNISKNNVLVLSDYAKGTLIHVRELISLAKSFSIPIIIDPKGSNFDIYKGATLITPNFSEFEEVVGLCENEKVIINKGMQLINRCNLSALLITRSEYGMTLLQQNKKPLYFNTQAKKVSDVTGAGDTVISVLAAALAAGNSLEYSCFLSNVAAGIVINKLGTSAITLNELKQHTYDKLECNKDSLVKEWDYFSNFSEKIK